MPANKKIYADGEIVGGKLKLKDSARFVAELAGLKGEVRVTVGRKERIRSIPQNSYYWGVLVKMIADYIGEAELELVHEAIGLKFAGIPAGDGKAGRSLLIRKSTTDMTTLEFEEYLEKCRNFASLELGIRIPLPNEILEIGEIKS